MSELALRPQVLPTHEKNIAYYAYWTNLNYTSSILKYKTAQTLLEVCFSILFFHMGSKDEISYLET